MLHFLEDVNTSGKKVYNLSSWGSALGDQQCSVRKLSLGDETMGHIQGLLEGGINTSVVELDLCNKGLNTLNVTSLAGKFTALKTLNVSRNEGLELEGGLKGFEEVDLSETMMELSGVVVEDVKILTFKNNTFHGEAADGSLGGLEGLDLQGTKMDVCKAVSVMSCFRGVNLNLSDCLKVSDEDASAFDGVVVDTIVELNISGNDVTAAAGSLVGCVGRCGNLKVLDVSNTGVRDWGGEEAKGILEIEGLDTLRVFGNRIGEGSGWFKDNKVERRGWLECLGEGIKGGRWKALDLGGNNFGSKEVNEILGWAGEGETRMEVLEIGGNTMNQER